MSRPRNEQGGFFPKRQRHFKKGKIAGHHWGWWVRQLRKDWIGFQESRKFLTFFIHAPNDYAYNHLMCEVVFICEGGKAMEEFASTLGW